MAQRYIAPTLVSRRPKAKEISDYRGREVRASVEVKAKKAVQYAWTFNGAPISSGKSARLSSSDFTD